MALAFLSFHPVQHLHITTSTGCAQPNHQALDTLSICEALGFSQNTFRSCRSDVGEHDLLTLYVGGREDSHSAYTDDKVGFDSFLGTFIGNLGNILCYHINGVSHPGHFSVLWLLP